MELQNNKQVHYHLVVDKTIQWMELRKAWNKVIEKDGHIERYANKFRGITLDDYLIHRASEKKIPTEKKEAAYQYGNATNWTNPNTTDIKKPKNLQNISAYIGKYISKSIGSECSIYDSSDVGRVWGCSDNLRSISWPSIKFETKEVDNPGTYIYDSLNKLFELLGDSTIVKKAFIGMFGQRFVVLKSNTDNLMRLTDENAVNYYLSHYDEQIKLLYL
jgi:hypothetical protein